MPAEEARPRELRLFVYVALGTLVGALYVAFDAVSESRLETGTLTGAFARAHALIDRVSPVVVGALLGVAAYSLRLRSELSAAREAASRAEALRARLQKIERDQAVWVLAAAVLHGLNNPLHALGLLLDEHAASEGDEPRRADLALRARAQAERARAHLEALRALRGAAEPDVRAVPLDELIAALAADAGKLAAEDGITLRFDRERAVVASADPSYVRTILENLVDNSLHALRAGRRGVITIALASNNGRALVRISDDGPPLDDAARALLFEPLRSTKTHGLGLGLPIARALARAMDGDLALDPKDEKAFVLDLPLA